MVWYLSSTITASPINNWLFYNWYQDHCPWKMYTECAGMPGHEMLVFLLWFQASGWQGPHLLRSLTSTQCWVDAQWIFLGAPKARSFSAGDCLENQEKLGHCNHCFSRRTCNSSSTQASERQLVHIWACYSAWRP